MYQYGKVFKKHLDEQSKLHKSMYDMIPFVLVWF